MMDRITRYFAGLIIDAKDLAPIALSYAPNWNGRATRTELFVTLVLAILAHGLIFSALQLVTGKKDEFALTTLTILLMLPVLTAAVRRLHDTSRYGATLGIVLIPYFGWIWVAYFLLRGGDTGPNEFGHDPCERRHRL